MSDYCFYRLFDNCTSLTTAPELPAKSLAESCYHSMFSGCTSLTITPELPAKSLAESCYHSMFLDCTSLTTAPELPAKSLEYDCYYRMFSGCTSLTSSTIRSTSSIKNPVSKMFSLITSQGTLIVPTGMRDTWINSKEVPSTWTIIEQN